nr:MAG TPA: hypothetical protein [Crassvirales sp.]
MVSLKMSQKIYYYIIWYIVIIVTFANAIKPIRYD